MLNSARWRQNSSLFRYPREYVCIELDIEQSLFLLRDSRGKRTSKRARRLPRLPVGPLV